MNIANGQAGNFVQLFDYAGDESYLDYKAALETAADSLVAAFPSEFQNQFKVYDFGFYLHQEDYDGPGYPDEFERVVREIDSEYYLAFGRQTDQSGVNSKVFVDVKLPEALFSCLGEDFLLTLETEMDHLANLGLGSSNVYSNIGNAIEEAKSIIGSVITCCDTGARSNDCPSCIFDAEQNIRKLKQKGYVEITHNGFEIETDVANVVTKLDFKIQAPPGSGSTQMFTINYLDDIILYSNSDQGNVFYQIDYVAACALDFIESPLLGAYEYEEHTIVLNEDGAYRFFFKINTSISASFRSESGERVLFPIVPMLIKRAVLGGFNVAAGLAVETVFKAWIDGHETYYEAWENLEISYWNVFLDFAEGALSPNIPPYLQFGLDVFRNSLVYVLETGLYDFTFETFITTAAESAIQVSLLRLCLKALPAVGNKAGSAGRILKKNNPNTYNLIVSWVNNNPGRLYSYVSDIVKPQPGQGYLSVFKNIHEYLLRVDVWEELIVRNVPEMLRRNLKFLSRLSDNPNLFNYIDNLTPTGKTDLANNADLWIRRYDTRVPLKGGNVNEAVNVLGGILGSPHPHIGGNYVKALSAIQETKFNQLISSSTIDANLASNLGLDQSVIQAAKEHMFITEHLVETSAGGFVKGRFNVEFEQAKWWTDVAGGNLDDADNLRKLIAHEFIESKLMQEGILYSPFTSSSAAKYGAHQLSVHDFLLNFDHWGSVLGRNVPSFSLNPNLSNIDDIVSQIKVIEGL